METDIFNIVLSTLVEVTSACSDRALEQARESESVVWQCKALEQRLVRGGLPREGAARRDAFRHVVSLLLASVAVFMRHL